MNEYMLLLVVMIAFTMTVVAAMSTFKKHHKLAKKALEGMKSNVPTDSDVIEDS